MARQGSAKASTAVRIRFRPQLRIILVRIFFAQKFRFRVIARLNYSFGFICAPSGSAAASRTQRHIIP